MNTASNNRRLACLLAAVLTLSLGVLALVNLPLSSAPALAGLENESRDAETRVVASSTTSSDRTKVTTPRHAGVYHARVGSRFVFDLDYVAEFDLAIEQDGMAHSTGDHRMHAHGDLEWTIAARRPDEILALVRLRDLKLDSADAPASKAAAAEVAAECQIPLFVKMTNEGQLLGYAFDERQGFEARAMLRGLLGPLAFVVPFDAANTWDVESDDQVGTFAAHYRRMSAKHDGGMELRRTKTRYLTMVGFDEGVGKHQINGLTSARIDEELGWLRHAAVDERLEMALPIGSGSARSRVKIKLNLTKADSVAEVCEADPWSRTFMPVSGVHVDDAHQAMETARWQELLEGVTLQDLLIELEGLLAAGKESSRETMLAWTKLAWLVILDKKVAAELREAILTNAVSEKVATMCLSALGKAGTPAAQAALVGVLDSAGLSSAVRSSAAIGMYGLQKPGKEVFAALSRQVGDMTALDEVRGSSLLAFGVLAGRSNEPLASGQTPIQHLLAMETKADRAAASAGWLDALGNSSDPRTLDRVVAHLGHKDPRVRQSAVEALRGHDDPRAASAIERLAMRDQDINVRVRAVQVLGMRNDRHAAITLARLARQDKSPVMRRAAIREISAIGHPDAKTLLAHSAQNDTDKGVREFAKMLLRSGG